MLKSIRFFIFSAGCLFLVTAVAKFISASGSAKILQNADPLFPISFRYVFIFAAIIEMIIGTICFLRKKEMLQAWLLAWLSTFFLLYRLGLVIVGYHEACPCLGHLTDALHVSPEVADNAMKVILAYLIIGSYGSLFWFWRHKNIPASSLVNELAQ